MGSGSHDEGTADAAALLGANRDVLQVRRGRGELTGGCGALLEGGVHASVLGGGLLQALDGLGELDVVAVGDERTKEGCAIGFGRDLGEQFGDGFGVGRVAGLILRVCGRPRVSKSTVCALLDGGEVERLLTVLGGRPPRR